MWKKYFSKYKWTDLFWILFVILTCFYIGNHDLLSLVQQEISFHGCCYGAHLPYITCYLLINLSFRIENKWRGQNFLYFSERQWKIVF